MANVYNANTRVWKVDTVGALSAESAPRIAEIFFYPSAVDDDLVFQDSDNNEDALVLKADPTTTTPIFVSFRPQGLRVNALKCTTIDGGTAYVHILEETY